MFHYLEYIFSCSQTNLMQYFVRYYFDVVIDTKDLILLPNEEKEGEINQSTEYSLQPYYYLCPASYWTTVTSKYAAAPQSFIVRFKRVLIWRS